MTAVLALVVAIAAITLLAFGERLGLSPSVAGLLIPVLLGFFVLVIAFSSATSRLTVFLDAADRRSVLRPLAMQLVLLLAGLALLPGLSLSQPQPGFAMLLAYCVAMLFVPAREPMSLLPDIERRMGGFDRATLVGLVTIGFSALLFLIWLQPVLDWVSTASGLAQASLREPLIAALAVVVLLGGLSAISRLAEGALAFALLFVGLPLILAFGAELLRFVEPASPMALRISVPDMISGLPKLAQDREIWQAALVGIGLGLVSLASTPGLGGPIRRGGFGLLIAGLAGAIAVSFARETSALPAMVLRDLMPVPPQNWPLFVFDEAIRGWMTVCSTAPRDAIDVIQECRRSGVTGAIPPEMFEIRPDMIGPALAASRGLPVAFGLVAGLIGPLIAFVALALLLQVAATGFSETVLYRLAMPKALRAARLARTRLVVIAILAPFIAMPVLPGAYDSRLAPWLALSLGLLLTITLAADGMLRLMRWVRTRRSGTAIPAIPA